MNSSQLSSILITGSIAYSLYEMIVNSNMEIIKSERKILLFCFGLPILLTPWPLLTNSYGESKGWCWIKEAGEHSYWMLGEFYVPLLLVFLGNMYCYYQIWKKIYRENYEFVDLKTMKKLVTRLKLYPVSLVFCFGLAGVHRIYYVLGNPTNDTFDIISGCIVSLYGFFNSMIYGLTKSVRKSIKKTFTHLLFSNENSSSLINN